MQVCLNLSFSKAAKALHITQPALSQRILNLEEELKISLFHRVGSQVHLSEAGKLLRKYCQIRSSIEAEALQALKELNDSLVGQVTIVGFSTFVRSLLIPKIGDIARLVPRVQISVGSFEIRDIEHALLTGEANFAFTIQAPLNKNIICYPVGEEQNVMISSALYPAPDAIYIDHDHEDRTTADFFAAQKKQPPLYQRIFYDEIYSIMDAVKQGLGRAIVPKHLLIDQKYLKIVDGYQPLCIPIFFCYYNKEYYTRLENYLIEIFTAWRPLSF